MIDVKVLFDITAFQRRLIGRVKILHPEVSGSEWLIGFPANEALNIDDEIWDVVRHGAGLAFTRRSPSPHLIVDMHQNVQDPDLLDAWRLQQFLESVGDMVSYDEAEALLRKANVAGQILKDDDGRYRVVE